ncbi:NAD-dependent epimerase/dehydratase family protein [Pseudomonas sp. S9]|uniref:NAD-dependent epimerase/dehydratase family protein n=1 Tax=Pseudomonas sp. S9 TaxID=686578 RepID=UPI00025574D1|nr:NAD-dependent epimerase/dehydratase family protein [Pseudomonas sp. S9]
MKYAVIGSTGLLGHHAARAIRAAGHELVLIHRPSSRIERLAYLNPEYRVADLFDHEALAQALRGIDGVIFSAGYYPTRPRRWQDDVSSALDLNSHFYAACLAAEVPRIVYTGAAIALPRHPQGEPGHEGLFYSSMPSWRNGYLLSKWALDEQAREQARSGLPVITAIPAMTLGEYDYGPSTGRMITAIAKGQMTRYVQGARNVIDAAEAGRGLLLALEKGRFGERYLLTGENIMLSELSAKIARQLGVPEPKPVSLRVVRVIAALGRVGYRLTGRLPLLNDTTIAVMAGGQFLDGTKAREELGFVAEQSLDKTLLRAIQWFRDNGYIDK